MKRKLLTMFMILGLSLSMAACGGDKEEKTAEKNTEQSAEKETDDSAQETDADEAEEESAAETEENEANDSVSEDEDNTAESSSDSAENDFTPMETVENGQITLDEDESFVIQ